MASEEIIQQLNKLQVAVDNFMVAFNSHVNISTQVNEPPNPITSIKN